MRSRGRWIAVAAAVLVIIVFAGVLLAPQLVRGAIVVAAASFGVKAVIGGLDLHLTGATARDIDVRNLQGEPIAHVATANVQYSLRDLLPGGQHAFGLTAFDVDRGHVTIIRHADGTYNIPSQKAGTKGAGALPSFLFDGRITNVRVDVYDRAPLIPSAGHFAFDNVN